VFVSLFFFSPTKDVLTELVNKLPEKDDNNNNNNKEEVVDVEEVDPEIEYEFDSTLEAYLDLPSSEKLAEWDEIQFSLKKKHVVEDDKDFIGFEYVCGVDISFVKGDKRNACACVVVFKKSELEKPVYVDLKMVEMEEPYCVGYLAFREVGFLVEMINEAKELHKEYFKNCVILVDGSGLLHPKGFGLACHLGVLVDLPTIGIAKNYLVVYEDKDLEKDTKVLKRNFQKQCLNKGDFMLLKGENDKFFFLFFFFKSLGSCFEI